MRNPEESELSATHLEGRLRPALRGKAPVLRFAAWFLALFLPMNVLYTTHVLNSEAFRAYLALIARITAGILSFLGTDSEVIGTEVRSPRFSIQIVGGCDGLQPSALLLSAVVAFPTSLRAKLLGCLAMMPILFLFNLGRIVFLFYAGRSYPALFDVLHTDVWQAIFVGFALFLWVAWARWASCGR